MNRPPCNHVRDRMGQLMALEIAHSWETLRHWLSRGNIVGPDDTTASRGRFFFLFSFWRLSWDVLRKSIKGIVNRVNIIKQDHTGAVFEDLIRGRGLFPSIPSIVNAQAASFTLFACVCYPRGYRQYKIASSRRVGVFDTQFWWYEIAAMPFAFKLRGWACLFADSDRLRSTIT